MDSSFSKDLDENEMLIKFIPDILASAMNAINEITLLSSIQFYSNFIMKKVYQNIENFKKGDKIGQFNTLDLLHFCDNKTQQVYLSMISSIELKYFFSE